MELQELEKYFATKVDLMAFREEVAKQFGQVYVELARLETRIATLETRIIKWFVATAVVLVGAAFAAGRYLP